MSLLEIKENIHLKLKFSGIDHPNFCMNKEHFKNYTKLVSYEYNSRGFRDQEWPIDLKNRIWCIGDSFTVGLGQPAEETWPALLEKKIGERCINIGEDGCSNDLMSLRAEYIKKEMEPKIIIIIWSFFWRRFINGKNVHFDYNKRELPKDDIENFVKNFIKVNQNPNCKILNYFIPDCMITSSSTLLRSIKDKNKKNFIKLLKYHYPTVDFLNCEEIEQLDFSRDGLHFDIKTCQKIVESIMAKY